MINCIFCKIANNPETESYRIFYSDAKYFAMFGTVPETAGHFIVVTKKHYSQVSEMSNHEDYFKKAIALAEANIKKLNAKAYTVKFNNNVYLLERGVGHVGHLHIHIIPKYLKKTIKVIKPDDAYFAKMMKLLT